jgi:hypothetical protein
MLRLEVSLSLDLAGEAGRGMWLLRLCWGRDTLRKQVGLTVGVGRSARFIVLLGKIFLVMGFVLRFMFF